MTSSRRCARVLYTQIERHVMSCETENLLTCAVVDEKRVLTLGPPGMRELGWNILENHLEGYDVNVASFHATRLNNLLQYINRRHRVIRPNV